MYADIIAINAPASAVVGDTVIVDVSVKNIGSTDWNIAVTAGYDSTSVPFQFDYLLVSPGQTVIFRGWFTMPSKNVKVTAWSWYWDGNNWVQEEQMTKDIAVAVLTPQVSDFRIADFYKV
jgi:subtilase family serine protease